jgi:hypothetical protein
VIVVSAPDLSKAPAAGSRQSASYVAAAKRLSEHMRVKPVTGPTSITQFMSVVAARLEASGEFCAVRTGYLDLDAPDIGTAADRLADAGARQIIVAAMPALLSRHMLSWADPDEAVDRLKKKCSSDLLYVRPDPRSCAPEIAAMLRMHVLEAASAVRQQSFSPFF